MNRLSQKRNKGGIGNPGRLIRRFQHGPESGVLAYFFENQNVRIHGRELARRLDKSSATVFRALKSLVREGWLTERKERHAFFFSVNPSPAFKAAIVSFSVAKISDAGVLDQVLSDSKGLHSFLLFGSAARGEDDPQSDYDFLLVAASSRVSAEALSGRLGRDVNMKAFTISDWVRVSKENPAFYRDVLAYSWVLLGEKPVL